MVRELGIQQIFAMSPQAEGRVERMASTLQDRLVTELRLAGATTAGATTAGATTMEEAEEANEFLHEYLPRFNKRFNKRFAMAAEQP